MNHCSRLNLDMNTIRMDLNQARRIMIRLNKYMLISMCDGDGCLIPICYDLCHLSKREYYRTYLAESNVLFWGSRNIVLDIFFVG